MAFKITDTYHEFRTSPNDCQRHRLGDTRDNLHYKVSSAQFRQANMYTGTGSSDHARKLIEPVDHRCKILPPKLSKLLVLALLDQCLDRLLEFFWTGIAIAQLDLPNEMFLLGLLGELAAVLLESLLETFRSLINTSMLRSCKQQLTNYCRVCYQRHAKGPMSCSLHFVIYTKYVQEGIVILL